MSTKEKWWVYLSSLPIGEEVELEHLEFALTHGNTSDRILCLAKESKIKYTLSIRIPEILALAEDYPDPEHYEHGIDGEYVRMQLGEHLVGYNYENFGGDKNIYTFESLDDPGISEYLYKNGWGELGMQLHEINLPDEYGNAWNL